jgi:RimJ/RimL family protein N-acetyltransferase
MGKIFEQAEKNQLNQYLDEILAMLETMKENGEAENFQEVGKQKVLDRLHEMIDSSERRTAAANTYGKPWDFSAEKSAAVFAENERIQLRPFTERDKEFYATIRRQYSVLDIGCLPEDEQMAFYWDEVQNDAAFFCTITQSDTASPVGYIGIKDTSRNLWEVSCELVPQACHQGYGLAANLLFLTTLRDITGKSQYHALVEVDNLPCQELMQKLDATLLGIYNYTFHSDAEAEAFEEDHIGQITDHMRQLAAELDVEPRKLLSHVLDYNINVSERTAPQPTTLKLFDEEA